MKINIMTILYYVVIVTQLSMVSFNNYNYCKNANIVVDTIKDDTTETVSNDTTETVSNDTVNIINDNLKHITHDQINNNASNQSFITDFSFWDFSQPSGFMIDFSPTISLEKVDLFLPLGNISPHIKLFNDKIGIKIKRSNFSKPYTFTIQYAQLLQLIRSLFFRKQQIHNNNFNQNQVNNNKVTFNQCFILNRSKGHEKIDIAHFKGLLYEIYYMALTNFNVNFYALDNINILKINYTYSTYINSNYTYSTYINSNYTRIGIEERSFRLLSVSSLLKLLGYNIIPKWLKILQLNLNHNTCTSSENKYTNFWTYDFYIAKVKIQRNLILFNTLKMHIFFSRSLKQCKMNEDFFNHINGKAPKTNFGVQIKINNDGIYEITITSFFKQKATININFMNFIIIYHTFNDTQLFLTIKLSAFNITLPLQINNTSQSTSKNYNPNKQENNQVSNLDSGLYNDNNILGLINNIPGILDNIMNIMNTNIK